MERIASFGVDHRYILPGIYLSRVDGDLVTYDMRTRKPNTGDLMSNDAMHSVEHLFATLIRNSDIAEQVVYFGPMGCQTGFYLVLKGVPHDRALAAMIETVKKIAEYRGEMFGASEIECGNYRNLSVEAANRECASYYQAIQKLTEKDLSYPEAK